MRLRASLVALAACVALVVAAGCSSATDLPLGGPYGGTAGGGGGGGGSTGDAGLFPPGSGSGSDGGLILLPPGSGSGTG